ncbi:hypothetical protein AZI85_01605 [Bdellovibrio bacteriovorus]|uniref:PIN domain-containing protein n=1 Tax=Bdellovibrio bacteriovorus TaxID=959 RepID=A0A150WW46_BDEBC|nr:hypothetical protein AZI85_01605 [Bdellovibrio bacteriovorus]
MCVIVDVNNIHKIFLTGEPVDPPLRHLKNKILNGHAKMLYGGQLREEYLRCSRFIPILAELKRKGSAKSVSDDDVASATSEINQTFMMSNDVHIIALAKVSGVRILITDDNSLKADFKNLNLISPKGKIYPRRGFEAMLRKCRE